MGAVVVRVLVNDDRPPDDIGYFKFVGEETHPGIAVIGEEDGEVAGMVAVGLIFRIPMFARCLKRVGGVSNLAVPVFMNVKAMGTDWRSTIPGGLIGRKSKDFG